MSTGERRRWWAIAGLIALWLVTIVEALGMGVAGFPKFQNPDFWRASFSGWGYPEGFSAVVGAVEMAGALLLLLPASARYGASVLIVADVGGDQPARNDPGRTNGRRSVRSASTSSRKDSSPPPAAWCRTTGFPA